ncbi:DUF3298 and DUF4163 domain-containing protein [Clostridium uliginosum]|uniref:DUF3298 domain-containing protein n=1 Tax=Clostridium uliginosum TaxID=119641 RepID=A0A1I1PL07_9CLOT|nr:DUF3298 and DUF4163 domain-containing protein [Clostridium uliginosum]SFD10559.1 Protein of unknown function [Clostridium uliginosum]
MNKKKLDDLKNIYNNISIPDNLESIVNETIDNSKSNRRKIFKKGGVWISIAASLSFIVILSNVSPAFAKTISQVPVVGDLVKLVVVKNYSVKEGNIEANIDIAQIDGLDNKKLEESLNNDFMKEGKAIYEKLIKEMPDIKEGHKYVGVDYNIKNDSKDILSIEVTKEEIQASSYVTKKHYTIDKNKEIVLTLPLLFKYDKYIQLISENIKEQMKKQMRNDENKNYFIDQVDVPTDDFDSIAKEQDFYINNDGKLVICFDKYEVAPGYMGTVEFVIPSEVIKDIEI